MKAKQIAVVALIVVVCSTLSAIVAYRRALRQLPPGLAQVASPARGSAATSGCIDFHDAGRHVGESGCVAGRLLRVYTSRGGNTFLDFCEDYRNCAFTSVIFASDKTKFGDLGMLAGKQVELEGTITLYQGRAEIVIHDPQQIRATQ